MTGAACFASVCSTAGEGSNSRLALDTPSIMPGKRVISMTVHHGPGAVVLAVLPVLPVFYGVASEGWRGLWSRCRAAPLSMTSTLARRRKVAIDAVCVAYLKARRPAQKG